MSNQVPYFLFKEWAIKLTQNNWKHILKAIFLEKSFEILIDARMSFKSQFEIAHNINFSEKIRTNPNFF